MNIFAQILKEAVDAENPEKIETVSAVKEEPETTEETTPEPVEEIPEEETTSSIKEDTKELIMTILDALENEMIAQGQELEEDESPDVAMELLYKLIDTLPDSDVQMISDTLSDYYDIEANDGETESIDEDYQEEEIPEEENELEYEDQRV
jgi:hypothetical protein